jgi:hypothetical protein
MNDNCCLNAIFLELISVGRLGYDKDEGTDERDGNRMKRRWAYFGQNNRHFKGRRLSRQMADLEDERGSLSAVEQGTLSHSKCEWAATTLHCSRDWISECDELPSLCKRLLGSVDHVALSEIIQTNGNEALLTK